MPTKNIFNLQLNRLLIISLLFFGFMLMISFSYGQSDSLNRTDKFGKKYGNWVKYEKGVLLWKATFYNGEPVGAFIHYYPNKMVKDSMYYYSNSPKVNIVSYYSNGKKESEGMFINKVKDGKWLYYNNTGKLIAEDNFKLGKKHGIFKLFSPQDGVLLKEESWENNVLHGEYKEYYTTGQLRLKWNHVHGKIDGAYESYYLEGTIWNKGQYVSNLRNGTWICYNREGNELKVEEIDKERITRTVLGFKTPGQWQKLDARVIAYFYKIPGDNIYIQLYNGKKVMLSEDNSLIDISNIAGVELFIFINENVLASYEAIIKIIEIEENEAEIILRPLPPFNVFSYDNHYKSLKFLMDASTPEDNE